MAAARTIFHVDLDAFFAAVERTLDPKLVGVPLVVGGIGPRGVVSCASYEVRRYGVRSAMPTSRARRLCPHAVFLAPRHGVYGDVSRRFMAILREYTPLVEAVSVDEAYLDMTGTERLHGPSVAAAKALKARVRDELGITASVGIATSRLVAKIASAEAKPDGLLEIPADSAESFLAPMPARRLPGIGPKAAEALLRLGIQTLGELAASPPGPLRRELGSHAENLAQRARGIDDSPVQPDRDTRSISAETTFAEDSADHEFLFRRLNDLAERVGRQLRKSGKHARVVSLKLRFRDFTTITRQTTTPVAFDGDGMIASVAGELLRAALRQRADKVRLLGVGVERLTEPATQLSLLDGSVAGDSALSGTLDAIRERFGGDSVTRGLE